MHGATFIQDLAAIMLVAGIITILFHRLRQPVVLGYILAGRHHRPAHPAVSRSSPTRTPSTPCPSWA
ncbi:MAG: hypothetical protein MZV65_19475 [Chromatiales bacterium]|nr:hypothetical protein [Chromatiales bacterium]